jgi:hypothetical protein
LVFAIDDVHSLVLGEIFSNKYGERCVIIPDPNASSNTGISAFSRRFFAGRKEENRYKKYRKASVKHRLW